MLKAISKGVDSLDQIILKPYTEISKNIEKKGKNVHDVTFWLGSASYMIMGFSYSFFGRAAGNLIGHACFSDRILNIAEILKLPRAEIYQFLQKINYNLRPAVFLGSAAMMSKGLYETMQYFMHKEPTLENAAEATVIATGLFLRASSMYLKDRNHMKDL
jgi:hypothetical protein